MVEQQPRNTLATWTTGRSGRKRCTKERRRESREIPLKHKDDSRDTRFRHADSNDCSAADTMRVREERGMKKLGQGKAGEKTHFQCQCCTCRKSLVVTAEGDVKERKGGSRQEK